MRYRVVALGYFFDVLAIVRAQFSYAQKPHSSKLKALFCVRAEFSILIILSSHLVSSFHVKPIKAGNSAFVKSY